MEINTLKVPTKEWVQNNFVNFEKDFLKRKYSTIESTNNINEKINKIFGSLDEYANLPPNEKIIDKILYEKEVVKKIFVEELPLPSEADENALYIIQDPNAIDESCRCYTYIIIKDENEIKSWLAISAPSYIYERSDIDFDTEFRKLDTKYSENVECFASYNELVNYLTLDDKYFNPGILSPTDNKFKRGYKKDDMQYNANGDWEFFTIKLLASNSNTFDLLFVNDTPITIPSQKDIFAKKVIKPEDINREG